MRDYHVWTFYCVVTDTRLPIEVLAVCTQYIQFLLLQQKDFEEATIVILTKEIR